MMSIKELEEAVTALATLLNLNADNIAAIAEGSVATEMVLLQYKARFEILERKLAEAYERIEALEKPVQESTIKEA